MPYAAYAYAAAVFIDAYTPRAIFSVSLCRAYAYAICAATLLYGAVVMMPRYAIHAALLCYAYAAATSAPLRMPAMMPCAPVTLAYITP